MEILIDYFLIIIMIVLNSYIIEDKSENVMLYIFKFQMLSFLNGM